MLKTSLNDRESRKPQRTHKMRETSNDSTCKIFTFRNIYRCKSTMFRSLILETCGDACGSIKETFYLERLSRQRRPF